VINFKSIGGAFASMATVSKSQLSKTFGLGGKGAQAGLMGPSGSAVWDGELPSANGNCSLLCLVLALAGRISLQLPCAPEGQFGGGRQLV
jgi:hypothetical protein